MKFKGFTDGDSPFVKEAYFDGYNFGDTLLEGVPFKAVVNDDGSLTVSFVDPKGNYEKGLNQKKWLKEAKQYAIDDDSSFYELPTLDGKDFGLEKIEND